MNPTFPNKKLQNKVNMALGTVPFPPLDCSWAQVYEKPDHKLRYPIGKFGLPQHINGEQWTQWIGELGKFPHDLRHMAASLTEN